MTNGYMRTDGTMPTLAKIKPKPFRVPTSNSAAPVAQSNGETSAAPDDIIAASQTNKDNTPIKPVTSTAATPGPATNTATEPPSNPVPTPPQAAASDCEVPATQRVKELCETLGICQPQYILVPSLTLGQDFFDGRANFLADDPYFEDGVGRVSGGYTKKGTRELVAEQALAALLEIAEKRKAQYVKILEEDDAGDE